MLYCYVESGALVDGPRRLPRNWRNVTRLDLATDESLKLKGWLPYIDVKPEHDKDTQYITGSRVITKDAVTINNTVNDYTEEQMAARLFSAQTARKKVIRKEAKTRIEWKYSDWAQRNVAMGVYGSDVGDPMKAKIAAMITESNSCEDAVDAAETLQAVRDVTPDWPIEMEVL